MIKPDGVLDDSHRETVAVWFGVGHGQSDYPDPIKATQPFSDVFFGIRLALVPGATPVLFRVGVCERRVGGGLDPAQGRVQRPRSGEQYTDARWGPTGGLELTHPQVGVLRVRVQHLYRVTLRIAQPDTGTETVFAQRLTAHLPVGADMVRFQQSEQGLDVLGYDRCHRPAPSFLGQEIHPGP